MTATTFTRLPLMAGSAVATTLGRAGHWTFERYMRAPLASTALMAMVTLTALAASNALYFQTTRHPAPFFTPARDVPVGVGLPAQVPEPMPAMTREQAVAVPMLQDTTGSVPTASRAIPEQPVGNADAFAVQKKLSELGLFNGTVDGFYGPMTANAIRLFEQRNNMNPTGALSRTVIDAILRSDGAGRAPSRPVAVVQPAPAPIQVAPVQPAPQPDRVVAQLPTLSPVDQAVDTVGNAAAQTLDSIVAAVDGSRSQPAANPIPAMPMMASTAQPLPAAVAPPQPVTAVQAAPVPEQMMAAAAPAPVLTPANDTQLVSQIQRGLASLGFYMGSIDGHPGDGTARAIREFENFHSYRVTGQINPDLVGLLKQAGANV
ncbi:peptidoglycan-binding protein [Devosia sp. 2618]|uniref:peptidoglycan-binding domain-containing protein n=1 Tax=Devosia sp. 2618 TaxID=3156454 RepID=UPI0033980DCF